MKKFTISLLGFLATISLLFLMTALVAKPKEAPAKTKPKAKPAPEIIIKEQEPEPDEVKPQPPMPSVEPSIDENIDIQVKPVELTDVISPNFTPTDSKIFDVMGLPDNSEMPLHEMDRQAIPLMQTAPAYPIIALQQGIEGWVKLKFDVNAAGNAENIRVTSASHKKIFNREAKKALQKWRFQPGKENGLPVGLKNQTVKMEFNLQQN